MLNALLAILYGFLFGVTSKIADLHNEHGLKSFRGVNILFGILWGFTMFLSTAFYPQVLELHLAILFLALIQLKIDYINHAIGTIIFLTGAFYIASFISKINLPLLVFIFSFYIIIDRIVRKCKKLLNPKRFLNLRFYLPPLLYSILLSDFVPFIIILTEIFGVYVTEKSLG